MPSDAPEYPSRQACNYPHLWPAQGRLDLRLRAMLEPGKITRSGGTSKGSAQKDTLLREASKALIRQGKMWVIARRGGPDRAVDEPRDQAVELEAAVVAPGEAAEVTPGVLRADP